MKVWSTGGIELWRRVAGVVTWRNRRTEVWRSGCLEAGCRCADVRYGGMKHRTCDEEAWRYGGLDTRCRSSDVGVWRYEGLEVR